MLYLFSERKVNNMNSYSQEKQDLFVIDFFKNQKNLLFLDVGSYNGIDLSNTYLLEKDFGWNGICVEANPEKYKELTKNRKCACLNCAVYRENGSTTFLQVNQKGPDSLSGIVETYDPRHVQRIYNELVDKNDCVVINTRTTTVDAIIDQFLNGKTPDYLKIDTEGSEFSILHGVDLVKHKIPLISTECNFQEEYQKISSYLSGFGYKLVKHFPFAGDYFFSNL